MHACVHSYIYDKKLTLPNQQSQQRLLIDACEDEQKIGQMKKKLLTKVIRDVSGMKKNHHHHPMG